ncbi:MAG TPA: chorismate mutase [Pyrinomonadaceae bacterium]|nr:chorismate mutase [Pyrinomonadaceae bacterium]
MSIEDWRAEIDEIDDQLIRLLNTRARLAAKIGGLKQRAGLPLNDAEREQRVVARMQTNNPGPLDDDAVSKLFQCIIRESRRVESTVVTNQTQAESVTK